MAICDALPIPTPAGIFANERGVWTTRCFARRNRKMQKASAGDIINAAWNNRNTTAPAFEHYHSMGE
jgi:hypothetical protein